MTAREGVAPHHLLRPLRGPLVSSAASRLARSERGGDTSASTAAGAAGS